MAYIAGAVGHQAGNLEAKLRQPAVPEKLGEVRATVDVLAQGGRTTVASPPDQITQAADKPTVSARHGSSFPGKGTLAPDRDSNPCF